ncbi:Uncharacterised protein [Mycobacterium tuberculosis]|nr:Uncharacterised protein [Mycobacterium tuberculosis]
MPTGVPPEMRQPGVAGVMAIELNSLVEIAFVACMKW